MPKKGHSEEQIIAALKQQEPAIRRATFVASWGSAKQRSTCESASMPVWECRSCANYGSCVRKAGG